MKPILMAAPTERWRTRSKMCRTVNKQRQDKTIKETNLKGQVKPCAGEKGPAQIPNLITQQTVGILARCEDPARISKGRQTSRPCTQTGRETALFGIRRMSGTLGWLRERKVQSDNFYLKS